MVDWQFMVFCRKVGFVVIYTFLVLFFVAKYDLWVMTSFVLTDDPSHAASTSACLLITSASLIKYDKIKIRYDH